MNRRTKQILAATATLLILIILQSISIPTPNRSLSAWHPATAHAAAAIDQQQISSARERYGHNLEELRARPTR